MLNRTSAKDEVMIVMEVFGQAKTTRGMLASAHALGISKNRDLEDFRKACTELVQQGDLLITPVLEEKTPASGGQRRSRKARGRAARFMILAPHHIASGYPGDYGGEQAFKNVPFPMKQRIEEAWKHPAFAAGAERKLATNYAKRVLQSLMLFKKRWSVE